MSDLALWWALPLPQIIAVGIAGIVVWHLIPVRHANVKLIVQIVFFLAMSAVLLGGRIVPYESASGDEPQLAPYSPLRRSCCGGFILPGL